MIERDNTIRIRLDLNPDPNSPNGKLIARYRQNAQDFESLRKNDPEGFANRWVAFGDGLILASIPRETDPTKADGVRRAFLKEAVMRAREHSIDFGAVFIELTPHVSSLMGSK